MNIVVGSAFRDAMGYLDRWFNQVVALQTHAGAQHSVRVIAVEGDSSDGTSEALLQGCVDHNLVGSAVVKCEHGQAWFGSTEAPARMTALSAVGNTIFEYVTNADDVLVYVESDLLWDAHTIGSLIDMAMGKYQGFDVLAPMVLAGPHFYDIWGFRKNGERFVPFAPYHIALDGWALSELDSAGSCLVMRSEVAQQCRIRNDNALVGWCEDARGHGFRIAVAPGFKVNHP